MPAKANCAAHCWASPVADAVMVCLQTPNASGAAVRAKLVAREISILERELDTKAVVYVMGRAHVHMRTDTNW